MAKRQIVLDDLSADKDHLLAEARRYLANGRETIAKAGIDDDAGVYLDPKYVAEGAGIAYRAALLALDAYAAAYGYDRRNLTSIEAYQALINQMSFRTQAIRLTKLAYQNLHILAYYQNGVGLMMVKEGLQAVKKLIDLIESSGR